MNLHTPIEPYGQQHLIEVDETEPSVAEKRRKGRQDALDAAHRAVDACGGYTNLNNPADIAYDETLAELIAFIEDLGGMDPQQRKRLEG